MEVCKSEDKNIDDGFTCPCCNQFVKRYRRPLGSSMAAVLLLMYKSGKRQYFHVENWLKSINKPELRADFHKLVFWGLLEKQAGKREDGSSRNGYYKITEKGMQFAAGEITVKEKAVIYNNNLESFEGKEITVVDALRKKFDYNSLMGYDNDKVFVKQHTRTIRKEENKGRQTTYTLF